jgi:hypothetical protein
MQMILYISRIVEKREEFNARYVESQIPNRYLRKHPKGYAKTEANTEVRGRKPEARYLQFEEVTFSGIIIRPLASGFWPLKWSLASVL